MKKCQNHHPMVDQNLWYADGEEDIPRCLACREAKKGPSGPLVDAVPFIRRMQAWIEQNNWFAKLDGDLMVGGQARLAVQLGMDEKRVRRILGGKQERITFDLADKIICVVSHPLEWHTDPELAEIYESIDLGRYDDTRWSSGGGRW